MLKEEWELLEQLFDQDELRTKEELELHQKENKCNVQTTYDQSIIESIIVYRRFEKFIYVEYLGINPIFQGSGRGSKIFKNFMLKCDLPIVLEVEKVDNELKQRRVWFYERLGFKQNLGDYYMPSFKDVNKKVILSLMTYPNLLTDEQFKFYCEELHKKVYEMN